MYLPVATAIDLRPKGFAQRISAGVSPTITTAFPASRISNLRSASSNANRGSRCRSSWCWPKIPKEKAPPNPAASSLTRAAASQLPVSNAISTSSLCPRAFMSSLTPSYTTVVEGRILFFNSMAYDGQNSCKRLSTSCRASLDVANSSCTMRSSVLPSMRKPSLGGVFP